MSKSIPFPKTGAAGYYVLLSGLVGLLEDARQAAGRVVNSVLTMTYWEVGRRIFEHEQKGKTRAEYGEQLLDLLARDLSARFGRGFSRANVFQMRQFYLVYREEVQTVSGKFTANPIVQTASGQLETVPFPLSWSHYVRLLSVQDSDARRFYEEESIRGGWSVRQLDRQISTLFYDRSVRSTKRLTAFSKPEDQPTADEQIAIPSFWNSLGSVTSTPSPTLNRL